MPERLGETHAIGAAQYVADRLDEAARRPQPDNGTQQEQRAATLFQTLLDRLAQRVAHGSRQGTQEAIDRIFGVPAMAEPMRQSREDDEEGKERDQREVGEVASMDEPVRIDA